VTVAFLDVGQGDSIYIESPNGKQMLIDGGANRSVLRELSSVMPFWDRSIDVVIATHPDKDHIGGLIPIAQNYRIDSFIDTGLAADTETYVVLEGILDGKEKTTRIIGQRRTVITLDEEANVFFEILEPDSDVSLIDDHNEASIIGRLVYGETEVMLTGDAGVEVELEILSELGAEALDADILKLGHHGSKTSSAIEFIEAVDPDWGIVSAGADNRYGHPHAEVTERFDNLGIPYLGTYSEGTIVFQSDGEQWNWTQ
jgi:competence protein ComEC